ncbi:MAG: ATP-binding protein [Candidatus Andersenbacteria bacterium]
MPDQKAPQQNQPQPEAQQPPQGVQQAVPDQNLQYAEVAAAEQAVANTQQQAGPVAGVGLGGRRLAEGEALAYPMPTMEVPENGDEKKRKLELLEAERVFREGIATVKDIIAPAAFKAESNFLFIGGKFARSLFVFVYPRFLRVGWFAPIINLNQTLDISMFLYPLPSELVLKNLKKQAGKVEASINLNVERGKVRDPILETAHADIENLRDRLQQGTERFFRYGLYITLYADSKKKLDELTESVETLMGTKLVYAKHAVLQMEQGFNSTLPIGNDELKIGTNMNTSPLSTSFPFISSELTSNDGILYGINRHNNSLVLFDRFSLENANSVVFAKSGAGKSYAVKLEILRSMMLGTDVIVIDPEAEYYHLTTAVDGAFIDISLGSETRLNPFDLPRTSDEKVEDIIRTNIVALKALIGIMIGRLTPEEDALLDRALYDTYAKKDITPNTQSLVEVEFPLMQDLQEVLASTEGSESLATRLAKFTEGTFAGLFNKPTNVQIKKQLVTFNIRDLEDELRPIGMFLVLNFMWNTVRAELKKRILVIDEAWWMMQYEDSARFLFSIAKRARKYYLGVTTISQDVADMLASDFGRAVVSNSSIQMLLRQSPSTIDQIQEVFHLTDGEKFLLLESDVGEGIFFAGLKHVAIKVVASYSEDQIITSDPKQILEIEKAKRDFAAEEEQGGAQQAEPPVEPAGGPGGA